MSVGPSTLSRAPLQTHQRVGAISHRSRWAIGLLSANLLGIASLPREETAASVRSVIWQDPGPVSELDFVGGPGGISNMPVPPFKFLKEVGGGKNPKLKVQDGAGTE